MLTNTRSAFGSGIERCPLRARPRTRGLLSALRPRTTTNRVHSGLDAEHVAAIDRFAFTSGFAGDLPSASQGVSGTRAGSA